MNSPQSMFPAEGTDPRQIVRTMQIIAVALMMGVVMFLGVVLFLRLEKQPDANAGLPVVSYVGAIFTVMELILRVFVPNLVAIGTIKKFTTLRPINEFKKIDFYVPYQASMIVGIALLEGGAFLNLIAFLIEGQTWSLGIVAVLLAIMAVTFPTFDRVDGWAEDQLRQLQLDPQQ